jgi:hypothetical protein
MVCWHNRYNLGDYEKNGRRSIAGKDELTFDDPSDFQEWAEENKQNLIMLPLYLYDHSGITMNTGGFSCPWDSGQVGYIFVTKEQIRKEYDWKLITAARRSKILEYLKGEVTVYDQYLTGDVYGYQLYRLDLAPDMELEDDDDPADYGEEIDSCWGFYGLKDLKAELKTTIDGCIKEDTEKQWLAIPVQAEVY